MTTIVDPLGTPVPYYNKSGTAILNMAPTGTTYSTAAAIPYVCGHQIILSSPVYPDLSLTLPVSSEVGDVVEVISITNDDTRVFAGGGDSLMGTVNGEVIVQSTTPGQRFVKVAPTAWYPVG